MEAPLLTFYGDDFTGSSAVMEVLSFAGIPTMLFLEPPGPDILKRYPDLKAVGVAGIARAKSPEWMRSNLPAVFKALKRLGAPLNHYKVCSTFDSSSSVGSIGTAAEIGQEVFGGDWIPLVVGAPAIGRYQVFGNLFAAASDGIHRLDRHPVMSRHLVTPMEEADLGRHLAKQTDLLIGCVDYVVMSSGQGAAAVQGEIDRGAAIISLDALDQKTLEVAGQIIETGGSRFVVGSQGVEYALVAHWRATGRLAHESSARQPEAVDQLFAVSGSCALTTASQIEMAEASGFNILRFDGARCVAENEAHAETERLKMLALKLLGEGRDVLVTSARGPDDPAIAAMTTAVDRVGISPAVASERLGASMGQLVADIRRETGLPRIAIAGGDTSGQALTVLGVEALSAIAPLAAGAPLCRAHADPTSSVDGLEITLKGGQMGEPDFFVKTKTGHV